MTLQASGAISLANLQSEFGGSNPISLSEYYRGGSYVPSGGTGANLNIPTSGAISLYNFYGTTAIVTPVVSSVSLSVNTSGGVVYFNGTLYLNIVNNTGFNVIHSATVQFSSDGGSTYYGLGVINFSIPNGASSGTGTITLTQSAYWGPLTTLYTRMYYNASIISSVSTFYSQYYRAGVVSSIGLSVTNQWGTSGTSNWNYTVYMDMVNNTGSTVNVTLDHYFGYALNGQPISPVYSTSYSIPIGNGSSSGSSGGTWSKIGGGAYTGRIYGISGGVSSPSVDFYV